MAILAGVDEEGAFTLYGIPDGELAGYKLKTKPLTDEIHDRLFPDKVELTSDDAQGLIALGRPPTGDVEGYGSYCCCWTCDDDGEYIVWEDWC
jgi:hypothetical protein